MPYKYVALKEARELAKAGVVIENRWREVGDSAWNRDWSEWTGIHRWEEMDWESIPIPSYYEDEFRVEVE